MARTYSGSFKNLKGDTITVNIYCRNEDGDAVSMGAEGDDIQFQGSDTVEITSEVNDTFDHLIQHSATIRLLVKEDQPQFFCADCRQVQVVIYRTSGEAEGTVTECVFAGYVEPQSYSQGYDETWDELELSCIDVISATEYHNYNDLTTSTYDEYKSEEAGSRRWIDVIRLCLFGDKDGVLQSCYPGYDLDEGVNANLYYDKSIGVSENNVAIVFSDLYINEGLILGDTLDDIWTMKDVLNEMMQYLNLRMVQIGYSFYIYSMESVKNSNSIIWRDIISDTRTPEFTMTNTVENLSGTMSNELSREEIYNQIKVKAEIEDIDTLIEDPLDSDDLISPYNKMAQWATEMYVECKSDSDRGREEFAYMIQNLKVEDVYPGEHGIYPWYIRLMQHPQWSCVFGSTDVQPKELWKALYNNSDSSYCHGGFVAMGENGLLKDASKYLVACINGQSGKESDATYAPVFKDICYKSANSTCNLTPVSGTTYYLVLGGSLLMTAARRYQYSKMLSDSAIISYTDPMNRQGFKVKLDAGWEYSRCTPDVWESKDYDHDKEVLYTTYYPEITQDVGVNSCLPPCSDHVNKAMKMTEDWTTKILVCKLKIGNKYVKQTLVNGLPTYSWTTEESTFNLYMTVEDEQYLLGDWHDVYNMNTEGDYPFSEKGLLIPITEDDNLQGKVEFSIISGIAMTIGSASKTQAGKNLWAITDCLYIKDFEIKIVSDNANQDQTLDTDIMYLTAENETFQNDKEITMKINSALTTEERAEMRIEDKVMICNPFLSDGTRITEMYSALHGLTDKPENFYIDCAYREHATPKVEFEVEQDATEHSPATYWKKWHSDLKGIDLFPFAVSENLQTGIQTFKIKENNVIS